MGIKIKFAWGLTIVWVVSWAIYILNDWTNLSTKPFNEWGDFYAGTSAPSAFLWLVVGYFQQAEELRLNTKAINLQSEMLKLQAEELNQSVEQQKELVNVSLKEHLLNKNEIEQRNKIKKIQAKPRVIIKSCNSNKTGQGYEKINLSLTNIGGPISHVDFLYLERQPENLKIIPSFVLSWFKGEDINFTITLKDGLSKFSITLDYEDGEDERDVQMLNFTYRSGVCKILQTRDIGSTLENMPLD